jgi:hypothetical protein
MTTVPRATGDQWNLSGRWLALAQGTVWFVLLIFGGIGLVLGPVGWTAAAAGRRLPRLSAALLIIPAGFLAAGWAPAFLSPQRSPDLLVSTGIVLVLVGPAFLAAWMILRGRRR